MTPAPTGGAYAGRRVLVLGATGFIGQRVVRRLSEAGAVVVAAGRDREALDRLGRRPGGTVEAVVCDIAEPGSAAWLVRDSAPVVTFNLAGYGVDRSERAELLAWRINAELPAELADAAVAAGPQTGWGGTALVHVGSALEYGAAGGDLHEETVAVPTTLYGRTKLAGTEAVAERAAASGLSALTARLFTVYGPGEHAGRLLPSLVETARTSQPLGLTSGVQRRDFTYVDDVAEGLLRLGAASAPAGTIVNLATGQLVSVRVFAETAAGVLGVDPALLRFGAVATRAEEMAHDPVAVARLKALTDWLPPADIAQGVRRMLAELAESRPAGPAGPAP